MKVVGFPIRDFDFAQPDLIEQVRPPRPLMI